MNIAIYNSSYIEKISYDKNIEFFKEKLNINCKKITIDDIISDKLLNYDLFIIPGGKLLYLQHEIGYNGKIKIIEYLRDPCTFMRNNILLFTCHPELNNYDYYLKYIQ